MTFVFFFRCPRPSGLIRDHQELLLMISALQIEADARKRQLVGDLKRCRKLWLNMFFSRTRHWMILDGGLEHFLFSHILGIIIPIDWYFSKAFKPPTRWYWMVYLFSAKSIHQKVSEPFAGWRRGGSSNEWQFSALRIPPGNCFTCPPWCLSSWSSVPSATYHWVQQGGG